MNFKNRIRNEKPGECPGKDNFKYLTIECARTVCKGSNEQFTTLLKGHEDVRNWLLMDDSEDLKLLKSLFLVFSEKEYDLVDLMIFNSLSSVQITLCGHYSYLNNSLKIVAIVTETLLVVNSQVLDGEVLEDSIIYKNPDKADSPMEIRSFEVAKKLLTEHLKILARKNNVGLFSSLQNNESEETNNFILYKQNIINHSLNFNTKNESDSENELSSTEDQINNDVDHEEIFGWNCLDEKDKNEVEVNTVRIDMTNFDCFFDVDAICAFIDEEEVVGIKSQFELTYSRNHRNKIYSTSKFLSIGNGSIVSIQELFVIDFAEIPLLTLYSERIRLFLVFNVRSSDLEEDEIEVIESVTHELLVDEINSTIKSKKAREFERSYKMLNNGSKKRHYFKRYKSNEEVDKKVKSYKEENLFIEGRVDNLFVKNLLCKINTKLKNRYKAILFLESYGTKNVFCSSKMSVITERLNSMFDLSIISIRMDLCGNISLKNKDGIILSCTDNFISDFQHYGLNSYYFLNCSAMKNYNGSTIKLVKKESVDKTFIEILANGIFKANIYTPLITQYLPQKFRYLFFPVHTSFFCLSYLYNWSYMFRSQKKIEKMIKDLEKSKQELIQSFSYDVNIRAEFNITSLNIPSFKPFIDKLFLKKRINYCRTMEIISLIRNSINSLILKLKDNTKNDIFIISRMALFETYFFERYLRGGSNLHSIPTALKRDFLVEETNDCVKIVPVFDDVKITIESAFLISRRLIDRNAKVKIKFERKEEIHSFLNIIESDMIRKRDSEREGIVYNSLNYIMNEMVENLLSAVCKNYCLELSDFYNLSSEKISKLFNALPITRDEIIDFYFLNPPEHLKRSCYYGLFLYVRNNISPDEIFNIFIETIKSMNIKYFPRFINGKKPSIRRIAYKAVCNSDRIGDLINLLKKGLKFNLSDEDLSEDRSRSSKSALAEIILVYIGLYQDVYRPENKKLLFEDKRYPFYLYTFKWKIENCFKCFSKNPHKYQILNSPEVEKLNIADFSLDQMIEYLNTCGRFIKSVEVLRYLDELMKLTRFEKFIPQSDEYYNQLFNWQKEISNPYANINFLFNGTNFKFVEDESESSKVFQLLHQNLKCLLMITV